MSQLSIIHLNVFMTVGLVVFTDIFIGANFGVKEIGTVCCFIRA